MTVINFQSALQQAQTVSFQPLPDGTYDLVVIEAKPTESSTQKPMIRVKYRVETGPSAGKTVFNQYTFTSDNPTALAIFFRHMSFHGLDADFFMQNPPWEQVAATLMGRRVRVELGTRMWQGEPRNEVNRVMPPDAQTAGQVGPAGPQQLGAAPVAAPQLMQAPAAPMPQAPVQPPTVAPAPVQPPQPQAPMQQPPQMPAPQMPQYQAPAPVGPPPAPTPSAPPGWSQTPDGQWVQSTTPAAPLEQPQPAPQAPVGPPPQQFEQPYPQAPTQAPASTEQGPVPPPPPVPS